MDGGTPETTTTPATPAISWRAHPAASQPGRAAVGGGIIAAVAFLIGLLFWRDGFPIQSSIALGLCGGAVLVFALQRFFLPSVYEITDEGIAARHFLSSKKFRWSELRRFVHDERGGFLSTRARPSRLDSWQGMHLVFDAKSKHIIDAIEGRMRLAREAATWAG